MAQLNIRIFSHEGNLRYNVWVRGRKMTDAFMKKHYGADWKDSYEALYACGKNKYGIEWVTFCHNPRTGAEWQDFCDNPSKATTPIKSGLSDKIYISK